MAGCRGDGCLSCNCGGQHGGRVKYTCPAALDKESTTAGHRVGYESASQFSREYRRLFGAPPRSEIARLREAGASA